MPSTLPHRGSGDPARPNKMTVERSIRMTTRSCVLVHRALLFCRLFNWLHAYADVGSSPAPAAGRSENPDLGDRDQLRLPAGGGNGLLQTEPADDLSTSASMRWAAVSIAVTATRPVPLRSLLSRRRAPSRTDEAVQKERGISLRPDCGSHRHEIAGFELVELSGWRLMKRTIGRSSRFTNTTKPVASAA